MPVERITKEQLKERLDRGEKPTILDVRLKYAYEHSTVKLPGAIRVPPYAIESVPIPTGSDIVAYDSDPNELVSTHVAAVLLRKGIKITVLKGGVPEWLAANFPIETKEAPRSAPPEPGSLARADFSVSRCCRVSLLLRDAPPRLDLAIAHHFRQVWIAHVNARHAYPLYHGLGGLFVWLHPGEPARTVNLASAVFGALAVGLTAWLAARLAESTLAGLAAGMFLAFSYTFWSQAITAEVYTLHLLLVGAALVALLAWAEQPAVGRLALFYAIYALGFGNHLSMVLLLPALAVFLLIHRRPGPADPCS